MSKAGKERNIPIFGGIASLREAKGWRQGYLAEKAGVSQSLISRLERGKGGTPSYEHLTSIASALDTTVDELKSGEIKEASVSIRLSKDKYTDGPKNYALKADPIIYQQSQKIPHYSQHYPLPPFDGAILYDHMQADLLEAPPILRNISNGYAISLSTDELRPRYKRGDTLLINPNLQPTYEDDVVVHLNFGKKDLMIVREVATLEVLKPDAENDEGAGIVYDLIRPKDRADTGFWEHEDVTTFLEGNQKDLSDISKALMNVVNLRLPGTDAKLEFIDVHVVVGSYKHRNHDY